MVMSERMQMMQDIFFNKYGGFVKKDDPRYPEAVEYHKELRQYSDSTLSAMVKSIS